MILSFLLAISQRKRNFPGKTCGLDGDQASYMYMTIAWYNTFTWIVDV